MTLTTNRFLDSLGSDGNFATDRALAQKLALDFDDVSIGFMLKLLDPAERANFRANQRMFERIALGMDPDVAVKLATTEVWEPGKRSV